MLFSMAFMLFLETLALSESCNWIIPTELRISSSLLLRFLWFLPKIYFLYIIELVACALGSTKISAILT